MNMSRRLKLSIRMKFVVVLSGLLLLCASSYLYLAIATFREDKKNMVFDLNRSVVSSVATELEHQVLAVQLALQSHSSDFPRVFESQANWKAARWSGRGWYKSDRLQWGVTPDAMKDISVSAPQGVSRWKDLLVVREKDEWVAIHPSSLFEAMQNLPGHRWILAQWNEDQPRVVMSFPEGTSLSQLASEKTNSRTQVTVMGDRLVAFSFFLQKQYFVWTDVPESHAFSTLSEFVRRSTLLSLMILTLALILALVISGQVTRPLESLVEAMGRFGKGEKTGPLHTLSSDETSVLAQSFNQMMRDLSRSREMLEQMNRELEQKVEERTRELAEQNHAVKEAQEALLRTTRLASVGEVAARAAHEVLNPLTGILTRLNLTQKRSTELEDADIQLFADLLMAWENDFKTLGREQMIHKWLQASDLNSQKTLLEEDLQNLREVLTSLRGKQGQLRNDLNFLLSESQRISRIVQTMRSLSQVHSQKRPHSVSAIVREAFQIMADPIEQQSVEVRLDLDPSMKDLVLMDRDETLQALTNLIRNSLQALETQTGVKWISAQLNVRGNEYQLSLIDNGCGIPQEVQGQLFEVQFSTKSAEEGTGLGLSISRRFLRAAGGDLKFVASQAFQKTEFLLSWPMLKPHEVAA